MGEFRLDLRLVHPGLDNLERPGESLADDPLRLAGSGPPRRRTSRKPQVVEQEPGGGRCGAESCLALTDKQPVAGLDQADPLAYSLAFRNSSSLSRTSCRKTVGNSGRSFRSECRGSLSPRRGGVCAPPRSAGVRSTRGLNRVSRSFSSNAPGEEQDRLLLVDPGQVEQVSVL